VWIRLFGGKTFETPKALEKRADSHLSAARCVGRFFVAQDRLPLKKAQA
jgi:hypothetical protein